MSKREEKVYEIVRIRTMGSNTMVGTLVTGMEKLAQSHVGNVSLTVAGMYDNLGADPSKLDLLIENLQQLQGWLEKNEDRPLPCVELWFVADEED
jgi:hypothetical protein